MEQTGKWGSLIKGVGLEMADAVDQGMNSYNPGVLEILHTESTDAAQVNFTDFTDYTGFGYRKEGENSNEQTRYKGFDSKYIVDNMSGGVSVTVESIRRNEIADALKAGMHQGRDAMRFRQKLGFQLLVAGFDNNNREKNGFKLNWFNDGKAQFSVAHPSVVPGGSSQSNASSAGITLSSEDNIEIAELALENQTQDNGALLDMAGENTILAPIELRRTARILLESERNVGTDFNDINIYADGSIRLITSKYLGDKNGGTATNWFMVDSMSHGLHFIEQGGVEMEEDYDASNRTYEYLIHSYGTAASKGWKASWGSKGDGAAYSA